MMRFLTAGESHGPGLVVIVEGIPRGLAIAPATLQADLARRQGSYGRGRRSAAEPEEVEILGGIRAGMTTGAPVAVVLRHRAWPTWRPIMSPWAPGTGEDFSPTPDLAGVEAFPTRPRPGHVDLAAAYKYGLRDLRDAIERASARETAARTVVGALCRAYLARLGVIVGSYVDSIGPVALEKKFPLEEAIALAGGSKVSTPDPAAESAMVEAIDASRASGDTLGGTFVVGALGLPPGLGGYVQWDLRLDAKLAGAVMSIPSVKGVEIGDGFALAGTAGSKAHDPIHILPEGAIYRGSNRAGGLEGGLTNGEPLVLRAAVKPVPTLYQPLPSVDLATGLESKACVERSDTCVVPAAAVVAEAMIAWVLAQAFDEKFGGDTMDEVERALASYRAGWTRPHA